MKLNDTEYAFIASCKYDDRHGFDEGLAQGVNIDAVSFTDGQTSLILAISISNQDFIDRLLALDVDVSAIDNDGTSAIIMAASKGLYGCVETLISRGGDINHSDCDGWTAIYVAVRHSQDDCMALLVRAGADIECLKKDYPRAYDACKVIREACSLKEAARQENRGNENAMGM